MIFSSQTVPVFKHWSVVQTLFVVYEPNTLSWKFIARFSLHKINTFSHSSYLNYFQFSGQPNQDSFIISIFILFMLNLFVFFIPHRKKNYLPHNFITFSKFNIHFHSYPFRTKYLFAKRFLDKSVVVLSAAFCVSFVCNKCVSFLCSLNKKDTQTIWFSF